LLCRSAAFLGGADDLTVGVEKFEFDVGFELAQGGVKAAALGEVDLKKVSPIASTDLIGKLCAVTTEC
jgi:hypothetical protein